MTPRFDSFEEFWPYYVGEHRTRLCRALHYFGAVAVLACVVAAVVLRSWLLVLLLPVAGYGPAWVGHFFVERNRPATWGYVWYSLLGEFKMLGMALLGRMRGEVAKLQSQRSRRR